jgi:hypothetical protein
MTNEKLEEDVVISYVCEDGVTHTLVHPKGSDARDVEFLDEKWFRSLHPVGVPCDSE